MKTSSINSSVINQIPKLLVIEILHQNDRPRAAMHQLHIYDKMKENSEYLPRNTSMNNKTETNASPKYELILTNHVEISVNQSNICLIELVRPPFSTDNRNVTPK